VREIAQYAERVVLQLEDEGPADTAPQSLGERMAEFEARLCAKPFWPRRRRQPHRRRLAIPRETFYKVKRHGLDLAALRRRIKTFPIVKRTRTAVASVAIAAKPRLYALHHGKSTRRPRNSTLWTHSPRFAHSSRIDTQRRRTEDRHPAFDTFKIENDKMSLSYDKIVKISSALNVDISELFGGKHVPSPQEIRKPVFGRRVISRAGEGVMIDTDVYASLYVASDLLHKKVVPIVVDVKVKRIEDFGDFIRHGGENSPMSLKVQSISTPSSTPLPASMSAIRSLFDSNIGHAYIAACDGPCRLLSICSADSAEIMKTGDNPASQHDHIRVDKT
jgi:hypothetical protein